MTKTYTDQELTKEQLELLDNVYGLYTNNLLVTNQVLTEEGKNNMAVLVEKSLLMEMNNEVCISYIPTVLTQVFLSLNKGILDNFQSN